MYNIGDKIVYPMHGAGVIKNIQEMDIFEKTQMYYEVTIAAEGMEILIPVDKAEEVGLREIPTHQDLEAMLQVLSQPEDKIDGFFHRSVQQQQGVSLIVGQPQFIDEHACAAIYELPVAQLHVDHLVAFHASELNIA